MDIFTRDTETQDLFITNITRRDMDMTLRYWIGHWETIRCQSSPITKQIPGSIPCGASWQELQAPYLPCELQTSLSED